MSSNRPELVILRGLQASGKSTWANAWVAQNRKGRVRVNKDLLRAMIDDGVYEPGVTEDRILAARDVLITGLMRRGLSVVVDDTNLRAYHVKKLAKLAHEAQWDWHVRDFTDVPVDICIERDATRRVKGDPIGGMRNGYVGADVIRDTWNRFLRGRELPLPVPTVTELDAALTVDDPYIPMPGTPEAVIVDIDGTVALKGTRSPFDESRVHEDQPNTAVIQAVQMEAAAGRHIIFCSGRTNGCFEATLAWLDEHVITPTMTYQLFMRKQGDDRPDKVMKKEIFDNSIRLYWNIVRVYDDRNQVVRMWRSLGLTVLQVAEGNF